MKKDRAWSDFYKVTQLVLNLHVYNVVYAKFKRCLGLHIVRVCYESLNLGSYEIVLRFSKETGLLLHAFY